MIAVTKGAFEVTARIALTREHRASDEAANAIRERLTQAMREIPGVTSVALASSTPFQGGLQPVARWALDAGTSPVLVTSAMAASARSLARYLGAPRGAREADLARDLGVPPWKVRTVRDQSRSWSPDGIAAAVRAVAVADADIKGQAHDASYTLERLVLTVAALRESR